MTAQFTIEQKTIKALLHVAPKAEVRRYLVGIHVEWNPLATRAVATDGSLLLVRQEERKDDNIGSGTLIIPRDTLVALAKPKYILALDIVFTAPDAPDAPWRAECAAAGVLLTFTPVDGTFPKYDRLFGNACAAAPATEQRQYDPTLLATALAAGREIYPKALLSLRNLDTESFGGAVLRAADLYGLIMPWKADTPNIADFEFLAHPLEV